MFETIGQKLRRSRQEKHISLEQVSAVTRIRPHNLEALERDDLSAISSVAQARGFLRIYADFLDLDADELVPMARPPEPQPIISSSDASTPLDAERPAALVQETISSPAPARPNLLTSLRDRFMRHSNTENTIADAPGTDEQPAAPEPAFVPARYTEELPAEPAPVVVEEPATTRRPTKSAKRSSNKKTTTAKRSVPQKAKASAKTKAGPGSEEKKKIMNMSQPKRG